MSLPGRESETVILRLPSGMRDQLKELAASNLRSMNSEIVFGLQQYITEKGQASADSKR